MLPTFPVKITFDIANNPTTKNVWAHPQARILVLLWKPCHITSQDFWRDTLLIGKRIAEKNPRTTDDLQDCFGGRSIWWLHDFTERDVASFAEEALPYFTGEKELQYVIEIPEVAHVE